MALTLHFLNTILTMVIFNNFLIVVPGCIQLGVEMEVLVWVRWNIMILIQISGVCVHRCVRGEEVLAWPPVMVSFMQWAAMMLLLQTTVPGSWTMWKGKPQGHQEGMVRFKKSKCNARSHIHNWSLTFPCIFHPRFLQSSFILPSFLLITFSSIWTVCPFHFPILLLVSH